MLKLLVARHGETVWNVQRRFQGQKTDLSLTERGREQAELLSRWLKTHSIDVCYSSDARRAWETAEVIGRACAWSPVAMPSLRELDFGTWEGLTYEEAQQQSPDHWQAWTGDPWRAAPPAGESLEQLAGRVRTMVEGLLAQHAGQTVLLVGHGGPVRVLLATGLGLSPTAYWQLRADPGSLAEIEMYSQGGLLTRLNYTG
jgi:broad specificity phosphatase PhoE